MEQAPIPVVCDRCRAEGLAGEDPFAAFGALLDFDPVPRRAHRADGWSADVQRVYIAALSLTGSDRAACRAVGKSAFGVTQLLAHEGSESFAAARQEALAISADERGRRLAEGLRALAAEQSGWRPPDPPWAHAATRRGPGRPPGRAALPPPGPVPSNVEGPAPPDEEAATKAFVETLLRKYWLKLGQEREARLAGRIVEADYYVRQLTWIEVAIDLGTGDGFGVFEALRRGDYRVIDIAETPMSHLMGETRRLRWAEAGEPERPEHPPRRYLAEQDGFSTEPMEFTRGGQPLSHEEQRRIFEERHKEDAKAQVEWEARARREYEERRARGASS